MLTAGAARAQLVSDVVPWDRIIPTKEQVETDISTSRYHLGPVRLLPEVDVSNAGYNSNIFGQPKNPVGDWTATVNAGTKFILPFAYNKMFFFGDIFPGYTWYAHNSNLDHFTGTAGGEIAGFFNRLSFDTGARASESVVFHSESPAPTLAKDERVFARTDVDLGTVAAVFVDAEADKVRESQDGVPLQDRNQVIRYNRTDEALAGGFRFKLGSDWTITPEFQYTVSRFVVTPDERNNTSTGYLLGVGYNRPRFYLNLIGGYRSGDEYNSTFPHYATPVGSFFTSYFVTPWLELRTFGVRRVAYSVDVVNPYYFSMQVGGTANIQVASRILLKGFGLTGQAKYPIAQPVNGEEIHRYDRIWSYGGGISALVYRNIALTGLVTSRHDSSNLPGSSYSILQYSTFLSFTGEFMR